jgi:hypothetical protein
MSPPGSEMHGHTTEQTPDALWMPTKPGGSTADLYGVFLYLNSASWQLSPLQCHIKYGSLVTDCWIKSICKKCDNYKIDIAIRNIELYPPHKGDKWIMPVLATTGHTLEQLQALNWVRIHQQVLFLSVVLTALGRLIEEDWTYCRPHMTDWSHLSFPLQAPSCLNPHRTSDTWKREVSREMH